MPRFLQALMIAGMMLAAALVGGAAFSGLAGWDIVRGDDASLLSMGGDREQPSDAPVGDPPPGDTESPEADDDPLDDDCLIAATTEPGDGSPERTIALLAPTTRPARRARQRQYRPPRA